MIDAPRLVCDGIRGVLTMAEAAALVPNGRKRGVHPSTLTRWAKAGKLEVSRTPGGTLVTTEEALVRCMGIATSGSSSREEAPPPMPSTQNDLDAQLDAALGKVTGHARGRTPPNTPGGGGAGRRSIRRRSLNQGGAA